MVAPYGSALVAFSGGVDSSLALRIAARALPNNGFSQSPRTTRRTCPRSWTWRAGSPLLWGWSTW